MAFRRGGGKRRRDSNEVRIIDALRQCGAFVVQISGTGTPDILVHWGGRWMPFEVKTETGKLTKAQQTQQAGHAPYPVIRDVDQALKILLR